MNVEFVLSFAGNKYEIEEDEVGGARSANAGDVRFEVFTAVTMKNGVFWVVTPRGYCKNRLFGGTWLLLYQGDKNR
jgi:hypothetical protein